MDKDNFTETTPAMTVYVTADKKDYFNCSMYYMRRFFGLREILILAILVIVGLVLFFAMAQTFILILFGVCVVLILIASRYGKARDSETEIGIQRRRDYSDQYRRKREPYLYRNASL